MVLLLRLLLAQAFQVHVYIRASPWPRALLLHPRRWTSGDCRQLHLQVTASVYLTDDLRFDLPKNNSLNEIREQECLRQKREVIIVVVVVAIAGVTPSSSLSGSSV